MGRLEGKKTGAYHIFDTSNSFVCVNCLMHPEPRGKQVQHFRCQLLGVADHVAVVAMLACRWFRDFPTQSRKVGRPFFPGYAGRFGRRRCGCGCADDWLCFVHSTHFDEAVELDGRRSQGVRVEHISPEVVDLIHVQAGATVIHYIVQVELLCGTTYPVLFLGTSDNLFYECLVDGGEVVAGEINSVGL